MNGTELLTAEELAGRGPEGVISSFLDRKGRYAMGLSLKMVRRHCLECSGGVVKYVTRCSCDGLHSTRCEFWPFRFGQGVEKVRRRYGPQLVTPELMPDAALYHSFSEGTNHLAPGLRKMLRPSQEL